MRSTRWALRNQNAVWIARGSGGPGGPAPFAPLAPSAELHTAWYFNHIPVRYVKGQPSALTRLPPPMLGRIDHVGVAVEDLEGAIALYEGTFGMPLAHRETVEEQGVEAALLDVGDGHVELLQPLGPETPVGKFVAKRGEGLHHVAYAVADIEAALDELKERGIELIDSEPRTGIRSSRVAFIHPRSTGSVLTELVEPAEEAH